MKKYSPVRAEGKLFRASLDGKGKVDNLISISNMAITDNFED